MSRQLTSFEADPFAFKINMISTNIARIHSQNDKLQDFLEHREQLNKLKEIAYSFANNWKRLVTLSQTVQKTYEEVIASRDKITQSLHQHSEDLNRTVIADIKKAKMGLNDLELKMKHHQNRQMQSIRSEIQKQKKKVIEKVHKIREECFVLLEKAEEEEKNRIEASIDEDIKHIEVNYYAKYVRCRVALGQLKNLIEYYHWKNHQKTTADVSLSEIAANNFRSINQQLDDLDLDQRRVKSEVQWLRGKVRKQKKENKIKNSSYNSQQMTTLAQMSFKIQGCQQQLFGLDKICGEKALKENKTFNEKQISELIAIKERLSYLKANIENYSSFYQNFS